MSKKHAERFTWEEKELYRQHKKNMRNVKPKVDNEAPLLNVGVLYRPGVLESIAERLTQIEEQNFKLTKQINIIYRIRGKTDCYKPKSMNQKVSNLEATVAKNKIIFKDNIQLLRKIVLAKSRIDSRTSKEDQEEHIKNLMIMSLYPEKYKKKKELKNKYDPLFVNAGIANNISIQKSKCYLDVKDLTANQEMGRLTIQIYDGIVPKTAENFLSLCQQQRQDNQPHYTGSQFFRIIPGLFCLGGDVEYSIGLGGMSATPSQRYFDDENYILSHNAPGTLSMYNFEKNENASQFLITFKPLTMLDGQYVVFGKVIHGMNTLKSIEDLGFSSGKPKHKIIIIKCGKI